MFATVKASQALHASSQRLLTCFCLVLAASYSSFNPYVKDAKANPPRFLLLQLASPSALEAELNASANAGYRLAYASFTQEGSIAVVEKTVPETEAYRYAVVNEEALCLLHCDTQNKLQQRMNDLGAQGFRLVPGTLRFFGKRISGRVVPAFAVMEKPHITQRRYSYQLFLTLLESSLEKDLTSAAQKGFQPFGIAVLAGKYLAIAEREIGTSPESGVTAHPQAQYHPQYRTVRTDKRDQLLERISSLAAEGFRIISMANVQSDTVSKTDGNFIALLEKRDGKTETAEYFFLSQKLSVSGWAGKNRHLGPCDWDKELNAATAKGFQVVPGWVLLRHTEGMFSSLKTIEETGLLMEKNSAPAKYEYKFNSDSDPVAMLNVIRVNAEQGFGIYGDVGSLGILSRKQIQPER